MKTIHVWPQEIQTAEGQVTYSARVENKEPFTLWFCAPEAFAPLMCARAESFAASTILLAMQQQATLRVHAPLSPSFLRNLEELQALWSCWHSGFKRVEIVADSESESTVQAPDRAISTFSGGVDSCYTMWRHTQKRCGRRALPLQTGVMIHGSEIELERVEMWERALQRSRNMLDAIDVNLVHVASNFRYVMPHDYVLRWFGTLLTSVLLLFQESHTTGLIPASFSYHGLVLPYASTPLNDPLFSTARFTIEHDGAVGSRAEKLREIIQWPGVLENLRVCNQPKYADVNCGRCEKCVRNILTLRIVGVTDPPCFPNRLSNADIEAISMSGTDIEAMSRVIKAAEAAGVGGDWVPSVKKALRSNARRALLRTIRGELKSRVPRRVQRSREIMSGR